MTLAFVLHTVATLAMFGAIWIVQLVHYPLFSGVGEASWTDYEGQHQMRITWVVGPLMILELVTAVWLVFDRPLFMPNWTALLGVVLVGVIWLSTAFVQMPLHRALSQVFDAATHQSLVATNWIRTATWSLRAGLVGWLVYRLVP